MKLSPPPEQYSLNSKFSSGHARPGWLAIFLGFSFLLQAQDTIPDRWEETYQNAISFWENKGQCIDQNGDPIPELKFYSEGAHPTLLLHEESKFSMILKVPEPSPSTNTVMKRLDFWPVGEGAIISEPTAHIVKEHFQNFYTPNTAPDGIEHVFAYSEIVYPEIYPGITMRFYSGSRGQKMSVICWPGSNPNEVAFQFSGQDSRSNCLKPLPIR